MKKLDYIILGIILLIACSVRLYKINTPLADLHSWRQVDTAAVARNFARDGINLMKPTYDDLSSIETGMENPKGYRFVEFPIYNALIAIVSKINTAIPIEIYGRVVAIVFSLLIIAVLYYIGVEEDGRATGMISALVYAFMPSFVFFSRVVLPETPAVSTMFVSLFFLYLDCKNHLKQVRTPWYFVLALFFFATSLLIKPTTIFYSFAALYIFLYAYRFTVLKSWKFYLFFIVGVIPLALWRSYIAQFPEGIPASSWLIAYVNTAQGQEYIFFRPAFFRWIFMERIGINILGIYLSGFLFAGCCGKHKKYLLLSIFFSALMYLFTFQGGNIQHEYYQTIALPGIAVMVGLGAAWFLRLIPTKIQPVMGYPGLLLVFALSFFVSFYRVKDFYNTPPDLPPIAQLIQSFTRPTDLIVTDRMGDTTLLYLADRKGAPAKYKEFDELKRMGYTYYVTADKSAIEDLKKSGKRILVQSDQFAIIQL